MRAWRAGVVLAAVVAVVAGCAGFTSDPSLHLGLDNATDRPVLVYVNGDWIGTFPAGTVKDDIATGAHGGPRWRLEARTDAGVVLVAAEVAEAPPAGEGVGAAAETTCGLITIWAGDTRPDVVPPNVPAGETSCE